MGSRRTTLPSSGSTHSELFSLFDEEPGGSQPPCLGEPRGPQEKVQQCTGEQLAGVVPMVQILDTPGLLGGGTRWWRRAGTLIRLFPSRLSNYPRPVHPVVVAGYRTLTDGGGTVGGSDRIRAVGRSGPAADG